MYQICCKVVISSILFNTVINRFIGLIREMVFARYIGEFGKYVRLLPVLDIKICISAEQVYHCTGKSVVTVNRLLTVLF